MEKFRKLTPHDLAFGIGRKATDEELRDLIERGKSEKIITAEDGLKAIKQNLAKRNIKKAS